MTGEDNAVPVVPSGVIVSPVPIPGMVDPTALNNTLNAQQKLSQAQATDKVLRDLDAGTDPDFVQTDDRFEAWTHQAIYDAVNGAGGMDVGGLQTLRKVWFDAYSELSNLSTFNQLGINRLLSHGAWAGASGDAAREASATFGRVANQISQVFSAMANRMDAVAWAAEATRTAVPAPASTVTTLNPDDPVSSIIPGLANPETVTQSREASEQARLAVVAAMNQIYKPSFPPSGSGVPSYANVARVLSTGGTPLSGTTGAGQAPDGVGASPSAATPSDTGAPVADSPSGSDTDTPASTSTDPASSDGDSTSTAGSITPTTAGPATTTPTVTTPATPTSPSGLAAGLAGVRALDGTVPPGTGTGGPGTPGPGKSLAGPSVNPGVGTGTTASSSAGARTGGAGAFGPMMPGGASRKGEDDSEHRTPDYLRRVQSEWTAGISALHGVIGSDGLPPVSRVESPLLPRAAPPRMSTPQEAPAAAPSSESPPIEQPEPEAPTATSGDQVAEMARLIAQYGWTSDGQAPPAPPEASAK